jgi:peptidoglycan/LPS O-acetylase OafA/YrhL
VFGLFRYMLAFCVAISHLWSGMFGGPAAYSVWGFYYLSGFLMTLVLHEKYGFSLQGVGAFAANRALRIYPAYFVVCLGMAALFAAIPETASGFLPQLCMPADTASWLYAVTLLTPPATGELVHGSSALRVELWHYIFMALGLARSRRIAIAWFAISLGYVAFLVATKVGFFESYVQVASCSLAFSAGSLLYHLRDFFPVIRSPWPAVGAIALWWTHVWLSWRLPGGPWVYGLYTSLLFTCLVVVSLMRLEPARTPRWLARLDRLAGELSYPIYLCHWGVGVSLVWLVPQWSRANLAVFLVAFPLIHLIAYAIVRMVERPLAQRFSRKGPKSLGDSRLAGPPAPHFSQTRAPHEPIKTHG